MILKNLYSVSLSFILMLTMVFMVYGNLGDILSGLQELVFSFLLSVALVFPSVIVSYTLAKLLALKLNSVAVSIGVIFSEIPSFIIAIALEIIIWRWIFGITSSHSTLIDIFKLFIPAFLTMTAISFFQMLINLRPVVKRIIKSPFVRTMRSVGMSEKDIIRKISRNIDVEFFETLKHLFPFLLGESFVLENVYNFRGIGYEIVKSLNEMDSSRVIGVIVYASILSFVMDVWIEVKAKR